MEDNNETEVIVDEDDAVRLARYKTDLQKDADVMQDPSEKADEDTRFVHVSGGMWEDFLEDEFSDRTKLEFDITSPPVNRFIAEWNTNRLGVEFKPDDSDTSDEDAELLNGIHRADFRQFSGKISVDNAVDEQAVCGYGAFELAARFEDDDDPENDLQRVGWRPIYNAYNSVFWDNGAKRIDKRDAIRCHKLIRFTTDSFKLKYPDKDPVSAYIANTEDSINHLSTSTRIASVFIAKRYEIVRKMEKFFIYNNLKSEKVEAYGEEEHEAIKDELKKDDLIIFVRERMINRQRVEVTLFSGKDILKDTKRIAGRWIPIIPVYGYHSYVNGQEWYRGIVRKLVDANRLFNMQVSQLAENSASAGQEVPIFDPDQMTSKEVKEGWSDKNNKSYLLSDSLKDDDGKIIHSGPVGYSKPGQLDASTTALMQIVPAYIQEVSGGSPQDVMDKNMSGKLFRAIQKRQDMNTQPMSDNIANSIEWSGVVYESMASDGIYNIGRIINTIGIDGVEGRKQLMQIVVDEDSGKQIITNDLNGKKFRVYSDVGPQFETLREQTVEDLQGLLAELNLSEAGQKYTPAVIATILENVSGVGLGPLKKLVRQDMMLQGLVKPETDEEKQFLAQAQQPQEDPNAKLLEAAAEQAQGEARERESKVLDNTAAAQLKTAQTEEVLAGIEIDGFKAQTDRIKTLEDVRREVFQSAQQGTLQ